MRKKVIFTFRSNHTKFCLFTHLSSMTWHKANTSHSDPILLERLPLILLWPKLLTPQLIINDFDEKKTFGRLMKLLSVITDNFMLWLMGAKCFWAILSVWFWTQVIISFSGFHFISFTCIVDLLLNKGQN